MFDVSSYWENRYAQGGNSGCGSYGSLAQYKSSIINSYVKRNSIRNVCELGCGDGNQLSYSEYPNYVGFDVSQAAINLCRKKFSGDATKNFFKLGEVKVPSSELMLSLDVIFHLVEDSVFEQHMRALFGRASFSVIIYSSNSSDNSRVKNPHVRHRSVEKWLIGQGIQRKWSLVEHHPAIHPQDVNTGQGSLSEFFIYGRRSKLVQGVDPH